jgi:hypothetical protein
VGEHLLRTELISVIEFGRVAALTETGVCQTSPMGKAHNIDSSLATIEPKRLPI